MSARASKTTPHSIESHKFRVLVGGRNPRVAQKVAHKRTVLQNSPTIEVSRQKQSDRFLRHGPRWSHLVGGLPLFVSEKRSIDGRAIQVDFATIAFRQPNVTE